MKAAKGIERKKVFVNIGSLVEAVLGGTMNRERE